QANMPLWYALLNCGFRLSASAGTDCFLNRIASRLPGVERVYVRLVEGFTYERWIEGLKAGRTFVTDGPMLEFNAGGQGAGRTLRIEAGAELRVKGCAAAQYPLDRLELVQNGQVVFVAKAAGDRLAIELDQSIPVARSGWVAVRVSGPPHPDQPDG